MKEAYGYILLKPASEKYTQKQKNKIAKYTLICIAAIGPPLPISVRKTKNPSPSVRSPGAEREGHFLQQLATIPANRIRPCSFASLPFDSFAFVAT